MIATNLKVIQRIEIALALLVTVVFYAVRIEIISAFIYLVTAILISIYFFPLRILKSQHFRHYDRKNKTFYLLSSFILASTIVASISTTIFNNTNLPRILTYIVLIGNLVFLSYYYLVNDVRHFRRLHFYFVGIASATLFL